MTKTKYAELEDTFLKNEENISLICLTETQQKQNKLRIDKDIEKIDSMRNKEGSKKGESRKGGGLMILYNKKKQIKLEKIENKEKDILEVEGKCIGLKMKMILVYFDTRKNKDGRDRNDEIRKEVEKIIEKTDEALIVLGDFNAHIGLIDGKRIDQNGRMMLDWLNDYNLTMLNIDEKCEGKYTWERNKSKSTIDYVLVNQKMYGMFIEMKIDEEKEKFDRSDHNLVTAKFQIKMLKENKEEKQIIKEYLTKDKKALEKFRESIEEKWKNKKMETASDIIETMSTTAKEVLLRSYKKKGEKKEEKESKPWMNEQIKHEIKIRKKLNRAKRHAKNNEEEEILKKKWEEQKEKINQMIRREIGEHEIELTRKIREEPDREKNLWKNINILKGKVKEEKENKFYNEKGEEMNQEEAADGISEYWGKIGKKHKFEITEEKREMIRKELEKEIEKTDETVLQINEHLDMAILEKQIVPMRKIEITKEKIKEIIKNLKNNKAAGPDSIKPEIFKEIGKSDTCIETIAECFNRELQKKTKPKEWKESRTKLIPKKIRKPTVKDYRPIALTNIAYKLFMSIIKDEIERHIKVNHLTKENQTGFTKGGRKEDNLFIIQYLVERTFKTNKTLILVAIDYSKAYDSIDREKMIETLIEYKIHPDVIDTIIQIYQGDSTKIKIGEIERKLEITSGIKQGCTLSSTLFKLITYKIIRELEQKGKGYKIENTEEKKKEDKKKSKLRIAEKKSKTKITEKKNKGKEDGNIEDEPHETEWNPEITLEALFFADDSILIAETMEDAEQNIQVLIEASEKYGLNINREKCQILIYNNKENIQEIKGIKVEESIKYLGVTIDNKEEMFKTHKKNMLQKAKTFLYQTEGIICRSINRLLIGKTFWKSIALPSVLQNIGIIPFTDDEIGKFQVIENSVYKKILGGKNGTPNVTLRGEVGTSMMKTRFIETKLLMIKSIIEGENELTKEILNKVRKEREENKWNKQINEYLKETNIEYNDIYILKRMELKKKVRKWDNDMWEKELETKTSIPIYRKYKKEIREERIYDNRPESRLLFQARSNTLNLNNRKRFKKEAIKEDEKCKLCGNEQENLIHFMIDCKIMETVRDNVLISKYQEENKEDIVGRLLFEHEDIEKTKTMLGKMWKYRDKKILEMNVTQT